MSEQVIHNIDCMRSEHRRRQPTCDTISIYYVNLRIFSTLADSKRGRCRSSPLRGWGHIGCESDEALPKSVSHTSFHLSLLFGGGSADIEEHNNPSKVEMTPLWRLFDRS